MRERQGQARLSPGLTLACMKVEGCWALCIHRHMVVSLGQSSSAVHSALHSQRGCRGNHE